MDDLSVLSNEEKASSVRSKIVGLAYQAYNLELDILVENAVSNPDTGRISELEQQTANLKLKQDALLAELSLLTAE